MTTNPKKESEIRFAFFGTPDISVTVLNELESTGLLPALVVTAPDRQQGRGMKLTASPVKQWAVEHGIPVVQPAKSSEIAESIGTEPWDVFVLVAYGKILPQSAIDLPRHGIVNVHPSLLPRFRGPSPVRSAILENEKHTGVTLMLLDSEMDHGPIIAQKKVEVADWPPKGSEFEHTLMREGGKLLGEMLPHWVDGDIEAREQNHDLATYCVKMQKEDGLLDLKADAYQNLLKISAYDGWPGTFAYFEKDNVRLRVKILDAHIEGTALVIDRVKPEGKQEMSYEDFLRSGARLID